MSSRPLSWNVNRQRGKQDILTNQSAPSRLHSGPCLHLLPTSGFAAGSMVYTGAHESVLQLAHQWPCRHPGESDVTLGPRSASLPQLALPQGCLSHTSGFIDEAKAGDPGELKQVGAVHLGQSRNYVCTWTKQIGSEKESRSKAWQTGRKHEA